MAIKDDGFSFDFNRGHSGLISRQTVSDVTVSITVKDSKVEQ